MPVYEEKSASAQFADAYIERCSKETETMIANESSSFLNQPISYLKKHKNEFIYLESVLFEPIGVEGVSLEIDDVFGTYDVMLGLKLQKKYEMKLKEQLTSLLTGDNSKFDLLFSHEDGLWDLNFALNGMDGFHEEISIAEAFQMIHLFLAKLVTNVKDQTS